MQIIPPVGKKIKVKLREVSFEAIKEGWNEYKTEDGKKIRLRTVAIKISKVLDEKGNPVKSAEGEPLYVVNHNTVVVTSELNLGKKD